MKTISLPLVVTVIFSILLLLGSTTAHAYVPKADITSFAPAHQSVAVYHPTEFIKDRIKAFEGFSPTKYKCSVSGVTLQGYGKSIGKKRTPSKISEGIASEWLHDDVERCVSSLDEYLPWWRDLSTVRQAAMIDLTYNMGIHKLMKFTNFLKAMEKGDFEKAKKNLLTASNGKSKSKYYKQVGIRAIEVSSAIATNMWDHMKQG